MAHYVGPKRRRVGSDDARVQTSFRLSLAASEVIDQLQLPGVLVGDGCSMGDVIEVALRELTQKVGTRLAREKAMI